MNVCAMLSKLATDFLYIKLHIPPCWEGLVPRTELVAQKV